MFENQLEFMKKLGTIFESIFQAYSPFWRPFEPVFRDKIHKKAILYETEGYHLTEYQFQALIKAIKKIGENSFYAAIIELGFKGEDLAFFNSHKPGPAGPRELSCDISYEEYRSIPFFLANALFSTKGTWGVMITPADFAVIGGADEFMVAFERNYPTHQQELKDFIDYYIDLKQTDLGGNYSWLIPFLDYMNPDWRALDPSWRDVK